MKIYKFDKIKTDFYSIHSFIREKLPEGNYPSMSSVNHFFIQMYEAPNLPYQEAIDHCISEYSSIIQLECHVCFDNRHDSKDGMHRGKPKIFYSSDALEKFCFRAGLEKTERSCCEFLGQNIAIKNKYNIHNTFRLSGEFNIFDLERFNDVVTNGIGSRKNYGFGLIIWKKGDEK